MDRSKIIVSKLMLISLLLLGLYLQCNQEKISISSIVGTYVLNHEFAPDTLFVLPDSTYIHRVHLNNITISDDGNWKILNGKIYFKGFKFYIPEYQHPDIYGTWVSRIEFKNKNEVKFILSSEQNHFYEKILTNSKIDIFNNSDEYNALKSHLKRLQNKL